MNKKEQNAFSLVEIIIMIFVVTAVFFAVVPFSVSNIKQARLIADWKDYISQVEYSFETLQEYKKFHTIGEIESIDKLMDYLDAKVIDSNNPMVKKYRYKMLNGHFYENINISKFDKIYIDADEKLMGIEYNINGQRCLKEKPCATVWVDLNGQIKPNIVGNDIFIYEIYKDSVAPYGKDISFRTLKKDCSRGGTGMFCSRFYLLGGDMH